MKDGTQRVTRKLRRLDYQILFPLFGEALGMRLGNEATPHLLSLNPREMRVYWNRGIMQNMY